MIDANVYVRAMIAAGRKKLLDAGIDPQGAHAHALRLEEALNFVAHCLPAALRPFLQTAQEAAAYIGDEDAIVYLRLPECAPIQVRCHKDEHCWQLADYPFTVPAVRIAVTTERMVTSYNWTPTRVERYDDLDCAVAEAAERYRAFGVTADKRSWEDNHGRVNRSVRSEEE